jgi:murein DD-endopeptidase MepM/ murein hydrolase activator NlpD
LGTPIRAADAGTVTGTRSGAPHVSPPCDFNQAPPPTNFVQITTQAGYTIRYSHVAPASNISTGATVNRGQLIGFVDRSGRTTGPHVHVSVRNPAGELIDPNAFFSGCR